MSESEEIKEYMTIDDSVDYRTMAKQLNEKHWLSMNHARVRSIYLSSMKKILAKTLYELGYFEKPEISDEQFNKIMFTPKFHELMADAVEQIKESNNANT